MLAPKMLRFTILPGCRSRYESDVQKQFPNRSNVFGRVPIGDVDMDIRMAFPERAQETEQKT